jgi:hypothetical protein
VPGPPYVLDDPRIVLRKLPVHLDFASGVETAQVKDIQALGLGTQVTSDEISLFRIVRLHPAELRQ